MITTSPIKSYDDLLEEHKQIIAAQVVYYDKTFSLYQEISDKTTKTMTMCASYLSRMKEIINTMNGEVLSSFFAEPGYGKSFIANFIINNFKPSDVPFRCSADSKGEGVSKCVIEARYSENYYLKCQYCSLEQYKLRTDLPFGGDQNLAFDSETIIDMDFIDFAECDDSSIDLNYILERAGKKIIEFETADKFDLLSVQKLILGVPSETLKLLNIVVRDVPGCGEAAKDASILPTSVDGSCVVFLGSVNSRGVFQTGTVKKLLETCKYAFQSSSQPYCPSIVPLFNIRPIEVAQYEDIKSYESVQKRNASFKQQISSLLDIDLGIEAVETTDQPLSFENKAELANTLINYYNELVFPPIERYTDFIENFKIVIESNRRKIIDYNCSLLKDLNILVLSMIQNQYKKGERKYRISSQFRKSLLKIGEKLHEKLSNPFVLKLECQDNSPNTVRSLVDNLITQFKQTTSLLFSEDIASSFLTDHYKKYYRKLRDEEKKANWKEIYPKHLKKTLITVNSLYLIALDYIDHFRDNINKKRNAITIMLRKDDSWLDGLLVALNYQMNSDADSVSLFIQTEITLLEKKISDLISDHRSSLKRPNIDINDEVLVLMKTLTINHQQYECKLDKGICIPLRWTGGHRLPTNGCASISGIPSEQTGSNNSIKKLEISKFQTSQLILESVEHTNSKNVINIVRNCTTKKLTISYDAQVKNSLTSLGSLLKVDEMNCISKAGVSPIFIITRPRGKGFKPKLLQNHVKTFKESNLSHIIFIVTELKYLTRYQKLLDSSQDYHFITVENIDDMPKLGYGKMQTILFLVAEHFDLQLIHVIDDHVDQFYEYLDELKIFCDGKFSLVRYLHFTQVMLQSEIIGIDEKKKQERVAELRKILSQDRVKHIIQCILHEQSAYQCIGFLFQLTEGYREMALQEIAANPNKLLDYLRKLNLDEAKKIHSEIENLFNIMKHVGRVSLMNLKTSRQFSLENLYRLSKPTHYVSSIKSNVNTFYIPSMRGIHSVSDSEFWKITSEENRKSAITKRTSEVLDQGWVDSELVLRAQMMMHGVGSFHVFSFGYYTNTQLSLTDYSNRSKDFDTNHFDSDQEEDEEELVIEDEEEDSNDLKRKNDSESDEEERKKVKY